MKTIKYVPKDAKGENKKFEGHVELRLPQYKERMAYLADDVEVDEEGEVTLDKSRSKIGLLIKIADAAEKHYITIDLTNLATGVKYETYDDLSCDPDCSSIISEVAIFICINGGKVGNG